MNGPRLDTNQRISKRNLMSADLSVIATNAKVCHPLSSQVCLRFCVRSDPLDYVEPIGMSRPDPYIAPVKPENSTYA